MCWRGGGVEGLGVFFSPALDWLEKISQRWMIHFLIFSRSGRAKLWVSTYRKNSQQTDMFFVFPYFMKIRIHLVQQVINSSYMMCYSTHTKWSADSRTIWRNIVASWSAEQILLLESWGFPQTPVSRLKLFFTVLSMEPHSVAQHCKMQQVGCGGLVSSETTRASTYLAPGSSQWWTRIAFNGNGDRSAGHYCIAWGICVLPKSGLLADALQPHRIVFVYFWCSSSFLLETAGICRSSTIAPKA